MSVRKDERSPYWTFDFVIKGHRDYGTTGAKTERQALIVEKRKKDEMRARIASGFYDQPAPTGMTINEAADWYYQEKASHAKSAYTLFGRLQRLVARIGPDTQVADITTAVVLKARDARLKETSRRGGKADKTGKTVCRSTVNRDTTDLLRHTLHWVERNHEAKVGKINWDDTFLREPRGRSTELDYDAEARLIECLGKINPYLVAPMKLAIGTGLRKSAVIFLRWDQFFPLHKEVRVILKSVVDDVPHTVPLTDDEVAMIEAERGNHPVYVFSYVCQHAGGGRPALDGHKRVKGARFPFTETGWAPQWRRALADAGISNFRFHDLRHTAATRVVRHVSLAAAARLLGHLSHSSTARYTHLATGDVRNARSAVEAAHRQNPRNNPRKASA